MAGYRNGRARLIRSIQKGQDPHQIHEAACNEFADELGYEREVIQYWWSQIALCRQKHTRYSQEVCEDAALHNVREVFDQRGRLAC